MPALDPAKWNFYVGPGSGMLDGNWSSNISDANPVLTNNLKLGMCGVQYIPFCQRYLMIQWYYPSVLTGSLDSSLTVWDVYESGTPWGPWNLIQSRSWGAGQAFYTPFVISKSLAADGGQTAMLATAGDFADSSATGSYTLTLIPMTISATSPGLPMRTRLRLRP